jgi:hypothetical protein
MGTPEFDITVSNNHLGVVQVVGSVINTVSKLPGKAWEMSSVLRIVKSPSVIPVLNRGSMMNVIGSGFLI